MCAISSPASRIALQAPAQASDLAPPPPKTATTRATLVRSGECGVRSITVSVVRHDLAFQLRTPHSPLRTHSPAPVSYRRSITRLARRFAARS